MRRYALPFALAVLLPLHSCGDADSGPTEPPSDFSGAYLLRYTLDNTTHQVTCSARGIADIVQSESTFGGQFEQTGECVSPLGSVDISGTGPITDGFVTGNRVTFRVEPCQFEGTGVGDPPNGASGTLDCTFSEDGLNVDMNGEWAVTRGVASMTITPDSSGIPLGGTSDLTPHLFGPDGKPLYGRHVTWESSDPSIAPVEGTGEVTGASAGTAVITASSVPEYPLEEVVVAEARVTVVLRFRSIQAGVEHTCGVTTGGWAYCWGRGADGRLGIGPANPVEPLPRAVASPPVFESVSPGMIHTCGVLAFGGGACWGSNVGGALGTEGEDADVPRVLPYTAGWRMVSAGSYGTCGVATLGAPYCWGSNDSGQLGSGSIGGPYQTAPTPVSGGLVLSGLSMTASVGGGGIHVCGVEEGGGQGAWCWGHGGSGELGNGDTQDSGLPVQVQGGLSFQSISSGWGHTCGIVVGGDAYCWGYALSGALGTGSTEPAVQATPVPVAGGLKFKSISAGDHFTCAITIEGKPYCWGWGGSHQLGNGEAVDRLVPTEVAGRLLYTSISAGSGYACGLGEDGYAYCWGANGSGQLGMGDQQVRTMPTRVGLQQ